MSIRRSHPRSSAKRGETIIEVMFAFAVFSLIAVMTISMMNMGLASSERSLEVVTARNELNAQAEALRFIHSSYMSELTLPECKDGINSDQCQKYKSLWEAITGRSVTGNNYATFYNNSIGIDQCRKVYGDEPPDAWFQSFMNDHAFVINTREILLSNNDKISGSSNTSALIIPKLSTTGQLFYPAEMNSARILYSKSGTSDDSDSQLTDTLVKYREVKRVEGLWVIAVKGESVVSGEPPYYDFYISACWYGPNSTNPYEDTVIRLYNPKN